jgi:putative inorganic carbon (HCO3(-)) transporter
MAINRNDLIYLIMAIAFAAAGAVVIGHPDVQLGLYITGALLGIGLVMAIYIKPSLGSDVLIFAVFTNISRAFTDNGLPSVIKPLVAIVVLAIVVRYMNGARMPAGRGKTRIIESYLFFFLMVTAASYLAAEDKDRALEAIVDLAKDIAIVYCIIFVLRHPNTWKQSAWIVMIVTAILCLLGAYQVLTGNYSQEFFGLGAVVADIGEDSSTYRISGPIKEPNIWAQIVVAVIPLAIYRILYERSVKVKLFAAALLVALLFGVLNSYSRGSYLALGILLMIIMLRQRTHPLVWFGGVAVVLLVLPFLPASYMARFETLSILSSGGKDGVYQEASFRGRASKMLTGLHMFADRPVLGVGAANYPNNYQDYATEVGLEQTSLEQKPHSLYIQILAETGIFGLAAFVGFCIFLFLGLSRTRASIEHLPVYKDWFPWISAIQLSFLSYLITSTVLHGDYLRFLWIFAGLGISAIQLTHEALLDPNQDHILELPV